MTDLEHTRGDACTLVLTVVASLLVIRPSSAHAQDVVFQGGMTVDPEQFYVGSHFELPLQGAVQPLDAFMLHRATSDYGNITSLQESPLRPGLLAVGTDDGLVQVTRDDGDSWQQADISAVVPEMTLVSRVRWSHHDEGTLYATFEAHKDNDFRPYVIKSTDYGANWTDISGDLPQHGPVRLHFYPFGGVARTVEWINQYAATHTRAR